MNRHLIIIFFYCFICSSIYGFGFGFRGEEWGPYSKTISTDCVFPFTFKNKSYSDCTIADGSNQYVPWCSITADYQGLFTYCIDYRNSSLVCLPKYTFNGKEYKGCVLLTNTSRYKQCQTNDPNNRYRYCVEEEIPETAPKPLINRKDCDPKYKDLAPTHTMW